MMVCRLIFISCWDKPPFLNRGDVVVFSEGRGEECEVVFLVYTLDKLVVYMRVSSAVVDGLVKKWNCGISAYGDILKSWLGHHPAVCRHNYNISAENGETWYFGVGRYVGAPNEYWEDVKIEFNPAKVGKTAWFAEFYHLLVSSAKYIDFKRFDVAIDIPVARSRLRLLKDQRKYALLEYSAENKTEYLGVRSSHGNAKLYNKALEQGVDADLTRLEITLEYEKATWVEFQRIFPCVFVVGGAVAPADLKGTDLVLFLSCVEHPQYLRLLGYDKRKKIERLLVTNAQKNIEPDKDSFNLILAEILFYGKDVKAEMWADFAEVDDPEAADVWRVRPKLPEYEQIEME